MHKKIDKIQKTIVFDPSLPCGAILAHPSLLEKHTEYEPRIESPAGDKQDKVEDGDGGGNEAFCFKSCPVRSVYCMYVLRTQYYHRCMLRDFTTSTSPTSLVALLPTCAHRAIVFVFTTITTVFVTLRSGSLSLAGWHMVTLPSSRVYGR